MEPNDYGARLMRLLQDGAIPSAKLAEFVDEHEALAEAQAQNRLRATRGDETVELYVGSLLRGRGSQEFSSDAADLISDVLHALHGRDIDEYAVLRTAQNRYAEEIDEANQS